MKCADCGSPFVITTDAFKDTKPRCLECSMKKLDKVAEEIFNDKDKPKPAAQGRSDEGERE